MYAAMSARRAALLGVGPGILVGALFALLAGVFPWDSGSAEVLLYAVGVGALLGSVSGALFHEALSGGRRDFVSKKGPVFQTAILAGTMGAKQTSSLIPLCHPLPLDSCKFEVAFEEREARIRCTCKTTGKTGVEMEALTGASIAALAFYDMCKALDPAMVIHGVRLLEKTGGKSDYRANE